MTTRDRLMMIFFAFGILLVFVSVPIMLTIGRTSPMTYDAMCFAGFVGLSLIVANIATRNFSPPRRRAKKKRPSNSIPPSPPR